MGTSLGGMVTMFVETTLESETLMGFRILSGDFRCLENPNTLLTFLQDKGERWRAQYVSIPAAPLCIAHLVEVE